MVPFFALRHCIAGSKRGALQFSMYCRVLMYLDEKCFWGGGSIIMGEIHPMSVMVLQKCTSVF